MSTATQTQSTAEIREIDDDLWLAFAGALSFPSGERPLVMEVDVIGVKSKTRAMVLASREILEIFYGEFVNDEDDIRSLAYFREFDYFTAKGCMLALQEEHRQAGGLSLETLKEKFGFQEI